MRTQLKNAIDALAETAKNATDWVAEKSDGTLESMRKKVTDVTRDIADSTARAEQSAHEEIDKTAAPAAERYANAVADAKAAAYRANQELIDTVKKHPVTAVAVGFVIGLVVGRNLRRG